MKKFACFIIGLFSLGVICSCHATSYALTTRLMETAYNQINTSLADAISVANAVKDYYETLQPPACPVAGLFCLTTTGSGVPRPTSKYVASACNLADCKIAITFNSSSISPLIKGAEIVLHPNIAYNVEWMTTIVNWDCKTNIPSGYIYSLVGSQQVPYTDCTYSATPEV